MCLIHHFQYYFNSYCLLSYPEYHNFDVLCPHLTASKSLYVLDISKEGFLLTLDAENKDKETNPRRRSSLELKLVLVVLFFLMTCSSHSPSSLSFDSDSMSICFLPVFVFFAIHWGVILICAGIIQECSSVFPFWIDYQPMCVLHHLLSPWVCHLNQKQTVCIFRHNCLKGEMKKCQSIDATKKARITRKHKSNKA